MSCCLRGEVDAEGLHASMLAISRRQCTHCLVDSVLMDATSRLIVGSERPAASDCAQPWDKRSTCSSFRPPLPSGLLSSGDHPSHRLVSSPRRLGSMDDRLLQEKLHIVWGSGFLTGVGAWARATAAARAPWRRFDFGDDKLIIRRELHAGIEAFPIVMAKTQRVRGAVTIDRVVDAQQAKRARTLATHASRAGGCGSTRVCCPAAAHPWQDSRGNWCLW